MPAPLLLDLSHTSHSHARTGVQRVARSLWRDLGPQGRAVTYDPHQQTWRELQAWELANLATDAFASKRAALWPLAAQVRGRARRAFGFSGSSRNLMNQPVSGIFFPEVFSPAVAGALPALFATTPGPRAALFHDAIALKFPEITPVKTVARFPSYLRELLAFDGIAANSDDSRETLLSYWRWLGISAAQQPVVTTISLGTELHSASSRTTTGESGIPSIVCVGSLEGRKNHLPLLNACEQLWAAGVRFKLRLIGLAHSETGRAALARVRELQSAGRPLRYDGPVDDATLWTAYDACAFTVYPSLAEGFGLPVLESLSRGKPCICSARGALGEAARDGGCVALDRVDEPSFAAAISGLLSRPDELASLAGAARARRFRTWNDYVRDLLQWFPTLPMRR